MKILIKSIMLTAVLLLVYTSQKAQGQDVSIEEFQCGDEVRRCEFLLPETVDTTKKIPLVIVLGPGGGGPGAIYMYQECAMRNGSFLLAGPDNAGARSDILLTSIIDYCIKNKNADPDNIVLCGYSAGGASICNWGSTFPDKTKGIIGVAATFGWADVRFVHDKIYGFIVGDQDPNYSANITVANQIEKNGGKSVFVLKPGIGHFSGYFGSPEFTTDWLHVYDSIQVYDKKPDIMNLKPENTIASVPQQITLEWTEYEGAEEYLIELGYYSIVYDTLKSSTNKLTIDSMGINQPLWWRVKAITPGGESTWSWPFRFTTKAEVPDTALALLNPGNGIDTMNVVFVFRWEKEELADFYHLQVATLWDSIAVDDDKILNNPGIARYFNFRLPMDTEFKWKVRSINSAGAGPWSEEWNFKTIGYNSVDDSKLISDGSRFNSGVFPNPVTNQGEIRFETDVSGIVKIEIFDSMGNLVQSSDDLNLQSGKNIFTIDTNLNSGMYYYRISNRTTIETGGMLIIK